MLLLSWLIVRIIVKISYQLHWINPRLVNPIWEPGMFLLGGEMRNLLIGKDPWFPSYACEGTWSNAESDISIYSSLRDMKNQNDCCVNASLVLFSPQSVLLISTFRIYITVISDVVRDSLRGTLADGRIFNGHTLLREWFQRQFNCRFQLCILLGRYIWVNSCLGFNLSLLLWRQSCWVTHYQYIVVCYNLCSFSLAHLTR